MCAYGVCSFFVGLVYVRLMFYDVWVRAQLYLKSFPFYFNKKIKNVNFEIKELEKIALLNRLKVLIPKYRSELRIKYKNAYLNASYKYILLTYLRSILKLIV